MQAVFFVTFALLSLLSASIFIFPHKPDFKMCFFLLYLNVNVLMYFTYDHVWWFLESGEEGSVNSNTTHYPALKQQISKDMAGIYCNTYDRLMVDGLLSAISKDVFPLNIHLYTTVRKMCVLLHLAVLFYTYLSKHVGLKICTNILGLQ